MFKYPDSPAVWFLATWTIAFLFWMMAPDFVVYSLIPNGRYLSLWSFLFFGLFIVLFLLGFHSAFYKKAPLRSNFNLRTISFDKKQTEKFSFITLRVCYILIIISLIATAIHLYSLATSMGLDNIDIYQGDLGNTANSLMFVRRNYEASRIHGLTIFKWINLPAFNLGLLLYFLAKKLNLNHIKIRAQLLILISLIIPAIGFFTGARSTSVAYLISYVYLKLSFYIHLSDKKLLSKNQWKMKNRILWRKLRLFVPLLAILIFLLFTVGTYVRCYARIETGKVAASQFSIGVNDISGMSVYEYSLYMLTSYFFRTINNGLLLVDKLHTHTIAWRTLRSVYTSLGIEAMDPYGLIGGVQSTMASLEAKGLGLFSRSNSSFPGYMFIDLGWFALILFYLCGYLIGHLYKSLFRGKLIAWVILPIIVFGIMDSWQSDLIFRSIFMLPILTGILASRYLEKRFQAERKGNRMLSIKQRFRGVNPGPLAP
jgi:hypothetical protein